MSEGIFELRARIGTETTRVLYFFYAGRHILLTNGFIKKKQKTPASEIEKAKMTGTKFNDFLAEQLKYPEFRKEYEALQPEHAIIQAMINARKASGLTQKELSERTGIAQGDISKLENGNANPSIRTLQRLATAMGMVIKVEFLPISAGK